MQILKWLFGSNKKNAQFDGRIFTDIEHYKRFLKEGRKCGVASDDGEFLAFVEKRKDRLVCEMKSSGGQFVGEHLIKFEPTEANFLIFSDGCKVMARRLSQYVDSGNLNTVSREPVFGSLSFERGETQFLSDKNSTGLHVDDPIPVGTVDEEYAILRDTYPGYKLLRQGVSRDDQGRKVDHLRIRDAEGNEVSLYFLVP